jgi:hypothetical protein
MSNSLEVTRPPVVLGIHVSADIADIVRQRAREADRSVSAELRRQLTSSGYLPRRAPLTTHASDDER